MRVHEFLNLVAQETRAGLPRGLGGFRTWKRYTLVQLFYSRRSVHYEVWVRGKERMLEIGLHCEADRATNSALLEVFDAHLFEIKDVLGERMEAEQWTSSWTRVHELMPYEKLDEATARTAGKRLAAMICVLQPMVAGARTSPPAARGRRFDQESSASPR
ncbi:MAG TPA: hypothetical protein VFD70_12975, partial [Anaerolineae bacterium]|nr:hypothetical protein [Anaerolineae bacterium]